MQILVRTDSNIAGESPEEQVGKVVKSTLGHLAESVTRVDVHLSDINSHKGAGNDKRCVMEARVPGQPPIAVSDQADTVGKAIDSAAAKLKRALDNALGKLHTQQRNAPRPLSSE